MAVKHDSSKDIDRSQLSLFIGGDITAYAKSVSLNLSASDVDASNQMITDWEITFPGKNSFTISSDSLVTLKEDQLSYDTLQRKFINKETMEFWLGRTVNTDPTNVGGVYTKDLTKTNYSGVCTISSLDLTSDSGDLMTYSVSLKGLGALVQTAGVTEP